MSTFFSFRRAGVLAALAALPLALAYRFAVAYRLRAGYPERRSPVLSPPDLGLPFEDTVVESDGGPLAAWFIPARGGAPGPGIVLVHGWESARDRALPNAQFLHAAGFHCLLFDVRGHGANPPETLPISGGEFGADAAAGLRTLLARPEVTVGAILGHSMGGVGAILAAAAAQSRCGAVISVSAPADPRLLTRQTFRLARLPIPEPIAQPLAWLTARVYVRPRGHSVRDISARHAVRRYDGPVLLIHGEQDSIIPIDHVERLEQAALAGRSSTQGPATVERYVVPGGLHSWLYEDEGYRRVVADFLARSLGGPYEPDEAARRAAAIPAVRPPEAAAGFSAIVTLPGPLGQRQM